MPIRKYRLTETEEARFRSSLSYLKGKGIRVGRIGYHSPAEPARFSLEQIGPNYFARVHALDDGNVAVALPAKLIIRKPGFVITEARLIPSWFDSEINLDNVPYDKAFLERIMPVLEGLPPRILNHEFVGRRVPLRPCQAEGVIIGIGYSPLPSNLHDDQLVTVKLEVVDQSNGVFSFDFRARVDRGIMNRKKYLAKRNSPGHSDLVDKVESEEGEIDFFQDLPMGLTEHSGLFERIDPDAPDPTYVEQWVYGISEKRKSIKTTGSTDAAAPRPPAEALIR